jgi:cytochrome P450
MTFRFDPAQPDFIDDPYPTYKLLRDQWPAVHDETTNCWLVSRYDDVRRILLDTTTFSSAKGNTIIDSPLRVGKTMGSLDPPRHDELRRAITPGLSNARIEAILPPLRAHLRKVLAELKERRSCDIVEDLGRPLLYGALGRMLGLDDQGAVRAIALSKNLFNDGTGPTGAPLSPDTFRAVFEFLAQEVVRRTTERGDDLISILLTAKEAGAPLSDPEIVANMATVLLAGNASIGHFFGNLIHALWRHPEQRRQVRADPSKIADAIEEGLRWDTSTQCFARQTTTAVEIAGVHIPSDSRLIVLYAAANRDERAFPDAERFDVMRGKTRHFGFGSGRHFCFGAHAARQMLIVMLEELLPVLGDYELDMANAKRVPHVMARGFSTLPASW